MIDAEQLVLIGSGVDRRVKHFGGLEISSEGFFGYQSSNAVSFVEHSGIAQSRNSAFVKGRGESQVIETVVKFVGFDGALDFGFEPFQGCDVVGRTSNVPDVFGEIDPSLRVGGEVVRGDFEQQTSIFFVVVVGSGECYKPTPLG